MNTILVVEEEAQLQDLFRDILEALGLQAEAAANGLQGLDKLRKGCFDGLLVDLEMPCMDGQQFRQEVETIDAELARRCIFVISDLAGEEKRTLLEETGASMLPKPFRLEELEQRLSHALGVHR